MCRYCGFQDSGYFCSNCGGRLAGTPQFDFDGCKVPPEYVVRLPAEPSYDFNAPPSQQRDQQRLYERRQRCEQFNEQLDEMARVLRYQGAEVVSWQFDRLNVGRLVDSLPADVPGREELVVRLWTIVSDLERAAARRATSEQSEAIRQALSTGDTKKAEKGLADLREIVADCPSSGSAALVHELEAQVKRLQSARVGEKQLAAFRKLLDKADKLAFQHEAKKAQKAYQECLFWLSRNDVPEKESAQIDVEQKLAALRVDASG